jgi:hypothetical protein
MRVLRDVLSVLAVSLAGFGLIWHWSLIWMAVILAVMGAAMASHPIDLIITDRRKHRRGAAGCAHRDAVPVDLLLTGERVAWLCDACGEQLPADWHPATTTGGGLIVPDGSSYVPCQAQVTMAQFAEGWDRLTQAMRTCPNGHPFAGDDPAWCAECNRERAQGKIDEHNAACVLPEPFYRESRGIDGYLRWCDKCGATWGTSETRDPFGPTLACPVCRITASGQDDGPTLTYACPDGHELEVPKVADPGWVECGKCAAEREKYDGRIAGPLVPRSLPRRVRQRLR